MFLGLASCNLKIRYYKKNHPKYNVYVGKGNNCKLLKKLFHMRHWWNIVNNPNHDAINLTWYIEYDLGHSGQRSLFSKHYRRISDSPYKAEPTIQKKPVLKISF